MKPIFFCSMIMLLAACSNSGQHSILQQPPYAAFTDSIASEPNRADLYYRRGQLLLQDEQSALAEQDFRQAWTLQPNEDHAIGVARYLIARNTDSAVQFLEKAVQQVPQSLVLQVSLARGYQKQQQPDKALAVCNRIIDAYPNQLDALQLKADILTAQEKPAEALATLEQAHHYAPFDPELAHNLAFAYAEAKNSKVLALTDSLIRADSAQRHAEPYYFKGVYFSNTGNSSAALQQFDEAIRRDYNYLDAHMEKGVLLYNGKQYGAAQKAFELALTISPSYADAHLWLGKTAEAQGRKAEAKNHYTSAYSLDKSLREAKEAAERL
ncbi:tetratricopeptide repeat protein [Paracnuella aquatica]|uniref:tetratricopeptide repeat protein n=1 Tax=Paracnuella aquatica TaxID=2268757 RepID=UPI000DEFD017|nr:tetratricopeptide repeat protein [Paracnuella aquatica]RPD44802.1 hypothetical protein DRJ53_16740 [Paracnuella aquatica]